MIQKFAFQNSSIEFLSISPHLTYIDDYAFSSSNNLCRVDIPSNSELVTIGNRAFAHTAIKSFFVPSGVERIGQFFDCEDLQIVEFGENLKLHRIDEDLFDSHVNIIIYVPAKSKTKVGKAILPRNPRELMDLFKKEGFDMF